MFGSFYHLHRMEEDMFERRRSYYREWPSRSEILAQRKEHNKKWLESLRKAAGGKR